LGGSVGEEKVINKGHANWGKSLDRSGWGCGNQTKEKKKKDLGRGKSTSLEVQPKKNGKENQPKGRKTRKNPDGKRKKEMPIGREGGLGILGKKKGMVEKCDIAETGGIGNIWRTGNSELKTSWNIGP